MPHSLQPTTINYSSDKVVRIFETFLIVRPFLWIPLTYQVGEGMQDASNCPKGDHVIGDDDGTILVIFVSVVLNL